MHKLVVPCSKSAGRPRACEVEARLHDLIHTAGALFLKHGYGKVSLEMLAREAHVAVRTIYVKFGGKAGLLKAVMDVNRSRFFSLEEVEKDTRPFRQVIDDFGSRLFKLITAPEAISIQRMVIAEAPENPELGRIYTDTGPQQVRNMLGRFFARPDIRAQLREDLPFELLPTYLISCVKGDHYARLLFEQTEQEREQDLLDLEQRLALFCHGVLRVP